MEIWWFKPVLWLYFHSESVNLHWKIIRQLIFSGNCLHYLHIFEIELCWVNSEWCTFLIHQIKCFEPILIGPASLRVSELFTEIHKISGNLQCSVNILWDRVILSESWVIHLSHLQNRVFWTYFHRSVITQSQWTLHWNSKNQW